MKITVGIPTKNRYETLSCTLLSIAFQTLKPVEVIIVDDSDQPIDLRQNSNYSYIFQLFDFYKIKWEVLYGLKKGQHFSHQIVQDKAIGDWIFRIDDDVVAEPQTLQELASCVENDIEIRTDIGALAPLVLMPNSPLLSDERNDITDLNIPNIQWCIWPQTKLIEEVDHLYSTFLYKKGITKYELGLSPVAHREETIFSHKIKREGYKLFVCGHAKTWHFRQKTGGIRSHQSLNFYEDDEKLFTSLLNSWNIISSEHKWIVCDIGLGDHFVLKSILPKIKTKYKNNKLILAVCFPSVFEDEKDIILKSIADAKFLFGENLDAFSIYKWMWDRNWKEHVSKAMEKFY